MILDTVLATIDRHAMLEPGDSVLVAVSGGPDSVALLHLLLDAGRTLPLSLSVAHLDHGLRGEDSDADRRFVEELASRLDLPFFAAREDVGALARGTKRSLEEAGRAARREFLRRTAARAGARRAALGHHRDDQAETVLMRLIAGSGRGGLSGIRPVAEGLFVRPLLDCSRAEILEYLRARAIPFRLDASNQDPRFLRSRLRLKVVPLLEQEFNPRFAEAIARTAELIREEDRYLDRVARRALRAATIEVAGRHHKSIGCGSAGPSDITRASGAPRSSEPFPHGPEDLGRTCDLHLSRAGTKGKPSPHTPAGVRAAPGSSIEVSPAIGHALVSRRVVLDAAHLLAAPRPIARRALRIALRRAGLAGRGLAGARIDEILALATRRGENAELTPGGGVSVKLEYGRLILEPVGGQNDAERDPIPGSIAVDAAAPGAVSTDGLVAAAHGNASADVRAVAVPGTASVGDCTAAADSADSAERPIVLPVPGQVSLGARAGTIRTQLLTREEIGDRIGSSPATSAYFDAERLTTPLIIRAPRPGDRMRPFGGAGTRKLSDLFTDLKLPRQARRRSLVVESGGEIVWVIGLRTSDPFRVTEGTRRVVVLEATGFGAPAWATSHQVPEPGRERESDGNNKPAQVGEPSPSRRPRGIAGAVGVREASTTARTAGTGELTLDGEPREAQESASPAPASDDNTHEGVLYSAVEIAEAVERLAREVSEWAGGREITILGVLQGSFIFLADLVRRIAGPARIGFVDRRGAFVSSGLDLEGARILLVEDILDTGESLERILEVLGRRAPAEIKTCVLFDKPSGRKAALVTDFRGLPVPDRWVVGYGLDDAGRHRNLPYLTWIRHDSDTRRA